MVAPTIGPPRATAAAAARDNAVLRIGTSSGGFAGTRCRLAVVGDQGGVVAAVAGDADGPQAAAWDRGDASESVGACARVRAGLDRPGSAGFVFDQAEEYASGRVDGPARRVGGPVRRGGGGEQVVLAGGARCGHHREAGRCAGGDPAGVWSGVAFPVTDKSERAV